ncbi:TPA: 5-bromo-4-chloroindolyl phosphate hydrolysis family protein, partial [Staphylococcus aureus]|nr:5-bromo-4-chloroindolyl phosphate hydrolysis family protein [Staphylococcus aureus]HDA3605992.1 5-bromo-4-chloroindolyl phosphate hydrolysis family protein [Staphylococcus aureus]HDH2583288.1 5-bromo-4-chloroindolyl phosphate hydrolysis family protein [Staphylococcus aureus]
MTVRYNISHIFGVLVGIPVAFLTSIFGMIALDVSFLIDMSIGIVGFLMTYLPIQKLTSRKYLNEIGLTRKDYRYIRNQLNHTHQKLRGILKTYVNIRSIK